MSSRHLDGRVVTPLNRTYTMCPTHRVRPVITRGKSGSSPRGSPTTRPFGSYGGDVVHGRSPNRASSPSHRRLTARRRVVRSLPGAPCSVRKCNATTSLRCTSQPITSLPSNNSASSGRSSNRPSGAPYDVWSMKRHEPSAPEMRAGDELEPRCRRHPVERDPHTDVLQAVDAVVRIVVVPGRRFGGTGFLHEHVLVEEAHGR